jgi:hypothetical protein
MSSAYPWINTPLPLSLVIKSFNTRDHGSGDNTVMCIGVAPHNKIEFFLFTEVHEILQFLRRRRILVIIGKVWRTYDQALLYPSSLYLIRTATKSLQENPGIN